MKKICSLAVILAALVCVAGCGSSKKAKLYIYNWSYYIPADVISDFEKANKCEIVYDNFASNEEMYTKLKAGGSGYDITFPSADYVSIMIKEGMLEKLDKSKLPNLTNLDPYFTSRIGFDKGNEYSVPYVMGAAGIIVNKEKVKNYPRNYHIFENMSLKGRMTMLDEMREVLGAALKTLGYSVNTTNEAELVKAKELVLKWKSNIQKYDSESFGKGFAAGEFWVVQGYGENVFKEADEAMKKNIDFIIADTGGTMYMDNFVILKDAKNKELAYKFINFVHEPAVYARICDDLRFPSINVGARGLIKQQPFYSFESLKKCELQEDLGDKIELWNTIWQQIRLEN